MTVKLKQKVMIDGTEFTVAKLAGKEVRLEAAGKDSTEAAGTLKYRRVTTVERLLDSQKPAKQPRARRGAAAAPAPEPEHSEPELEPSLA